MATLVDDAGEPIAASMAESGLMRLVALGLLQKQGRVDNNVAQTAVENSIIAWCQHLYQKEQGLRGQPTLPAHLSHVTEAALKREDSLAARLSHIWERYLEEVADHKNAERYLQQAEIGECQLAQGYLDRAMGIHETAVTPPHRTAATVATINLLCSDSLP